MKSPFAVCLGLIVVSLLGPGLLPRSASAAEESPAATRDYATAANLQNIESYELAAEAWQKFIERHKSDPRLDKAHYNLGVCCYFAGKLDSARGALQAVIKQFPDFDKLQDAYLYLGVTQYALAEDGKAELCDEAVRTFDALLDKFPQGSLVPDALYYRGEALYLRGKKQEASDSYRQLIRKHPKHALVAQATYGLGVCQEELGQHDDAAKTYDAFLKANPEHELAAEVTLRRAEVLLAAGRREEAARGFAAAAAAEGFALADYAAVRAGDCLAQLKQYGEAAAQYQAVVAKFPQSEHAGRAAVAAGKCHYLAGKHEEARKLLQESLSAGGSSAYDAAHWIAQSWLKEKEPAKALETVEPMVPKALADKSPAAPQLMMDQADALYEIPDRSSQSVAIYAKLAATFPDDPLAPEARYLAAFSALKNGDAAAAVQQADAFLDAHAEHELVPEVMHVKAESHLLLKQFPEAEAQYAHLLERFGNHAEAELWHVRRGLALHLQKKHHEAVDALTAAKPKVRRPDLVAEAAYVMGKSLLERNEPQEAIESLETAIQAQPKWRQADETLLTLARAYRQVNDPQQARATIERLIEAFPQTKLADEACYRLGEYAYLDGDFEAAAAAYRKVVESWPDSPLAPYALHELGCAEMDEGDHAAAAQSLSTFLEKYPDHELASTARFSRGMARHRLEQYGPAVEDLQAFLAADPPPAEKANARYLLGLCQMGLEQYGPASATFQSLLQDEPDYASAADALYQRAWALRLSGKEAEAVKAFDQLAQQHPDGPHAMEAFFHVGESLYGKKDYAQAAVAYYKAMQKSGRPDLEERAVHKLGWSYYHQGEYENARKTFRYQLARQPKGPLAADAAFMEGECFFQEDRFQEALAALEQADAPSKEEFQALRLLHAGQAAAQLGQWQKSLELLEKCTEQFPDAPQAPQAIYEQGWAQQKLENHDQAIKLYERAIALTEGEVAARAQFMIGEVEFDQKDYREAVKSYFKVMYGYSYPTWQAQATFEAARCFEVLEKTDQAVKLFRELLEKFPESERVPVAKKRLEQLTAGAKAD